MFICIYCLRKLFSKFYPFFNLKIVFNRGSTIKRLFSYKDKFPCKCSSGVVYQIQCEACGPSTAYVGKTINTLHERFYGPNGHLHPSTNGSALLEHLAQEISPKCEFNSENIRILDSCSNDLKLRYAESIHLTLTGPKHFTRISKIMVRQTRNVSLWAFVC